MERIERTGRVRTYASWQGDLHGYLQAGDFVDPALQTHFLEVLYPAHFDSTLVQMGEALDHNGPAGRARYATIQRAGYLWVYTGLRCVRERVEIV